MRPRLRERLDLAAGATLILVSAPAGFGKTTLVADWLGSPRETTRKVAWLSLDPGDNDPQRFFAYLIGALRPVAEVASSARELDAGRPSISAVLTTLLNELAASATEIVLVLDDYHVIDDPEIERGVAFLLEHLPSQVQIIVTSRADPALPLAGMRARGTLVEVRAADLRFTRDEAATYLSTSIGAPLAASDVSALEERTEGWIAALQLAALSMQGRDDPSSFVASFAGDDRYIVDYLVEEVLRRQPEAVQDFLLRTSVLDRLGGGLCDMVVGAPGSQSMLDRLDRANLFVVPLDDRRQWYRYHHLFADVLRARLLDEQPDLVPVLHRRASEWYEQHGEATEAINHALAGKDFERAADLVELAIRPMSQRRQEATVRRWLDALPERLFVTRPMLAAGSAGMRLVRGDVEGVDTRLRQAERWLDRPDDTGMVVVDQEAFGRLPASIAMYRTALAFGAGDIRATIESAERVLALVAPEDHLERGGAAGFLALATWTMGDLETADLRWSEAAWSLEAGGHIADAIGCRVALGDIRTTQGSLTDAARAYASGIALATKHHSSAPRGVPDMHVGMSALAYERNDLASAGEHLAAAERLGEAAALAQNPARSRIARARLRASEGDLDAALALLDEASERYASDFYPDVMPIAARKARIWMKQGRLGQARAWAVDQGVTIDAELSYVREFEHITLARLLMTEPSGRGAPKPEVAKLLERLVASADAGGRNGSVIEIRVLQALDHQSRGELGAAIGALEHAVALAEPEGFVRVFVDEGAAMARLLDVLAGRGVLTSYAQEIAAAVRREAAGATANRALAEPLSERELEVLRLLASDMDGPSIAAALVVSLHTVRSHTKRIYAKLGVGDRRAAVRRGAELHLLMGMRGS